MCHKIVNVDGRAIQRITCKCGMHLDVDLPEDGEPKCKILFVPNNVGREEHVKIWRCTRCGKPLAMEFYSVVPEGPNPPCTLEFYVLPHRET